MSSITKFIAKITGITCAVTLTTITLTACADATAPRAEYQPPVATATYDTDVTRNPDYYERNIALEDGRVVHCLIYDYASRTTPRAGMSCDWENAVRPEQSHDITPGN